MIGGDRIDGDNHAGLVRRWFGLGYLRGGGIAGVVVLHQLPYLLFQRHLAEQTIDSGLDFWIGQLGVGSMGGLGCKMRRSGSLGCLTGINA